MKRWLIAFLACSLMAGPALAAEPVAEGVQVEKMSPLRKLVPEGELEQVAAQQFATLQQEAAQKGVLLPADHPKVQRVRQIARELIPHASRWNENAQDWQWEVVVIDSPEVNAFVMPGGKIAVFTGIMDRLKLTDDEIAVILGHEVAHALREHGRERLAKSTVTSAGSRLLGFGLSAILGIDPSVTDAAAGVGANLAILKFSRQDETEADLVGLDLTARAGYDPRAGVVLWQKMGTVNKEGGFQWLSTHPAGKARIAEMQKVLPKVMPIYAKTQGKPVSKLPPYVSNVKGIAPVR